MSNKEYEVRRWLEVPMWFRVSASSPEEARDKAYELVLQSISRLKLYPQSFDKDDCVVADATTDKTVLYAYES